MAGSGIQQSAEVEEAAWLDGRLSPFDSAVVTSVVPNGFSAYARVLHPLDPAIDGQLPARWRDVASWSGVEMVPGVDFTDLALPEQEPSGIEPWPGQMPQVGTLHPADAEALAAVLARHTDTPDRCWLCLWDGRGSLCLEDGPRIELPARSYALFTGPLLALPALMDSQRGYSPNLWWPDDHAWCVATEIDLAWTYLGGSVALIREVLADTRLEAQPASPRDNFRQRVPEWLAPAIERAVTELIESGTATLETWRGVVHAQLERPCGRTDGDLRFRREPTNGFPGTSWHRVTERGTARLRSEVTTALIWEVIELL